VEVKYPSNLSQREWKIKYPDRENVVSTILRVVFFFFFFPNEFFFLCKKVLEKQEERQIVFLSFDPDICFLLTIKQKKYPVKIFFSHTNCIFYKFQGIFLDMD
jgi:hypothetical protein